MSLISRGKKEEGRRKKEEGRRIKLLVLDKCSNHRCILTSKC
ncbi:hypothetical protein [Phormidium nigroviride]